MVDEVLDGVVVGPPLRIECLAELEACLGIRQGLAVRVAACEKPLMPMDAP